jgi:hypothetical protein
LSRRGGFGGCGGGCRAFAVEVDGGEVIEEGSKEGTEGNEVC